MSKMKLNTYLVVIPKGMTTQLQVLDFVVNKPFKDSLREKCTDWFLKMWPCFCPQRYDKKTISLCV
jgi:hypothetical protein